jgi:hypothetical protein
MKTLELTFSKCIQDSQEYGSNNEHMVSRVYFSIDGQEFECNIRQPYGEDFSFETTPIEVETPEQLRKRVNYGEFRDAVESYFRGLVGSSASGIRISGKSTNIRMRNNTFVVQKTYEIHEAGQEGGGW